MSIYIVQILYFLYHYLVDKHRFPSISADKNAQNLHFVNLAFPFPACYDSKSYIPMRKEYLWR